LLFLWIKNGSSSSLSKINGGKLDDNNDSDDNESNQQQQQVEPIQQQSQQFMPICILCNKIFANSSNLKHHMKSIHFNEAKWICKVEKLFFFSLYFIVCLMMMMMTIKRHSMTNSNILCY
jgi:uncharacterized Zn-finger protein